MGTLKKPLGTPWHRVPRLRFLPGLASVRGLGDTETIREGAREKPHGSPLGKETRDATVAQGSVDFSGAYIKSTRLQPNLSKTSRSLHKTEIVRIMIW